MCWLYALIYFGAEDGEASGNFSIKDQNLDTEEKIKQDLKEMAEIRD